MLPRPRSLSDSLPKQVLLCVSCAMASAPLGGAVDRFAAFRANPPEGIDPSEYQREGMLFLAPRWGALLSDDKGLGKTGQALLAIPDNAPVVIVCPASLKSGWVDECKKWRPELRPQVVNGKRGWVKLGPPGPGDVRVLNYDIIPARIVRCRCGHGEDRHPTDTLFEMVEAGEAPADHVANTCLETGCRCARYIYTPPSRSELIAYLGLYPDTVLIADECQHVKHPRSEKTKRFREFARACSRVWGLSASPLENSEQELRGVYQSLGIYVAAFGKDRIFNSLFKESREKKIAPSGKARDEIRQRRSWVELGRTAEQVGLELPPLRFVEQRIVLTPAALAQVEILMIEAMATQRIWALVKAGEIEDPAPEGDGGGPLTAIFSRRRQLLRATAYVEADVIAAVKDCIALGPNSKVGPDMMKLRKALAIAKTPSVIGAFVQEVEDAKTPGILFSAHKIPVETVSARPGWGEISGRCTPPQRDRTLKAFKAGDLIGLACTIKAAGEGLNLHRAGSKDCTLAGFVDLEWNDEKNNQAAKRIHRRGQRSPCLITHFVADHPIDRHVAKLIDIKRKLIEAITITGGL